MIRISFKVDALRSCGTSVPIFEGVTRNIVGTRVPDNDENEERLSRIVQRRGNDNLNSKECTRYNWSI